MSENLQITADGLVRALYRAVFNREADDLGLTFAVGELQRDTGSVEPTVEAVVRHLLGSEEFAALHEQKVNALEDNSQFGEFALLVRRMVNLSARHRYVVDAGARGRRGSNSYDLLRQFGWRGLLIEANPALIASIQEEFAGLRVDVIGCAVSDQPGERELYFGVNLDVSSLTQEMASAWGGSRGSVTVQARRLADILRDHDTPLDFDLLSLDLEGEDEAVLNDLIVHSRYRPSWILFEASFEFRTRTLSDLRLEPEVRENYHIDGQTSANLLLRRTR